MNCVLPPDIVTDEATEQHHNRYKFVCQCNLDANRTNFKYHWKLCKRAFFSKKLIFMEQVLQERIGAFLHRNYADALETCR